MSFLSDDEVDERLKNPNNLINRVELHKIERGRAKDSVPVPIEIKKTIAILANSGERQQSLADAFEVHRPNVSYFENGLVGPDKRSPEIMKVIQKNRDTAETIAIDNLLTSLQLIPERLVRTKNAKTLSTVAKDMAQIANQMSGKGESESNKNIHLHLYAPPQAKVEDYDIIDV